FHASARLGLKFDSGERPTFGCSSCTKHVHTLTNRNGTDVCGNDHPDFSENRPLAQLRSHTCKSRDQNERSLPFCAPPDVCWLHPDPYWFSVGLSFVAEFSALFDNLFN